MKPRAANRDGRSGTKPVAGQADGRTPAQGRFEAGAASRDYRVIAEWIADGAEGPSDDDPRLERISVLPEAALLKPGDRSRVLVNAHYDDGRVVDVTHWSQFTATDEAVASVTRQAWSRCAAAAKGRCWFGLAAKSLWRG